MDGIVMRDGLILATTCHGGGYFVNTVAYTHTHTHTQMQLQLQMQTLGGKSTAENNTARRASTAGSTNKSSRRGFTGSDKLKYCRASWHSANNRWFHNKA